MVAGASPGDRWWQKSRDCAKQARCATHHVPQPLSSGRSWEFPRSRATHCRLALHLVLGSSDTDRRVDRVVARQGGESPDESLAWLSHLQIGTEKRGCRGQDPPAALWWSPSEQTSAQAQSGLPGLDVAPGLQTALEDSPSPACAHGRTVG